MCHGYVALLGSDDQVLHPSTLFPPPLCILLVTKS